MTQAALHAPSVELLASVSSRPAVSRTATRLSVVAAVLMAGSAAAGLTAGDLYQDPAGAPEMFRGYDFVTLVAVVPTLCLALRFARRGSTRAWLVWLGTLGFAIYDYAVYVFGAAAAVWLWRREPWGFVLAPVLLIGGFFQQLTYVTALVFQARADIPNATSFDPGEPLVLAAYALGAWLLLHNLRPTRPPTRPDRRPRHPPGSDRRLCPPSDIEERTWRLPPARPRQPPKLLRPCPVGRPGSTARAHFSWFRALRSSLWWGETGPSAGSLPVSSPWPR